MTSRSIALTGLMEHSKVSIDIDVRPSYEGRILITLWSITWLLLFGAWLQTGAIQIKGLSVILSPPGNNFICLVAISQCKAIHYKAENRQ